MIANPATPLRIVFRPAAGPRIGYGHLVRSVSLARALGVEPVVALRGGAAARRVAVRLGCRVVAAGPRETIRSEHPHVLVLDDPNAGAVRAWRRAAAATGTRVASIHDLGIAIANADLVVDGSVVPLRRPVRARVRLLGPSYAILDPRLASLRARRPSLAASVLIALGGGPRASLAERLARAILARCPQATVHIAGGFSPEPAGRRAARKTGPGTRPAGAAVRSTGANAPEARIRRLAAVDGLGPLLAAATVAVVGGGVSLYEACCLGVPTVALAVVPGQQPTVGAFAARRAVAHGGASGGSAPFAIERVACRVASLLADASRRSRLATRARALVDGLGAERVAEQVRRLALGAAA